MGAKAKTHFVGVCGAGMSALAQFHAMGGAAATGSDREIDRGGVADVRGRLESLGIRVCPQDGSGVDACVRELIVSTAVEEDNPDLVKARSLDIPIVHRADALARYVGSHRTVAVAGTSGKSTVTAMVYEILAAAGLEPSVITGAALRSLRRKGWVGNAGRGRSTLLVVEADESDGTLVRYAPWIGLLLNIGKDHKEVSEIHGLFSKFKDRSETFIVNADAAGLEDLGGGAATFGFNAGTFRGEDLETGEDGSRFRVDGVEFRISWPGRHNAQNALAAAAAAVKAGVSLEAAAEALSEFEGVSRRFERVGRAGGIEVIDDYAHNPDKVRAVVAAARLRGGRVLAIFQPHGFGPTRFLKDDFIAAFSEALNEEDVLWMPEIYYAGGTAKKDISSADIAGPVRERGRDARFVADRGDIPGQVRKEARSGDVVLVLGARDPSLSAYARGVLKALQEEA